MENLFYYLMIGLVCAVLLLTCGVYIYGALACRRPGASVTAFPVEPDGTSLDRLSASQTAGRQNASGLLLAYENTEAFALRALSARAAGRSLDLQYYYWKDDLTGTLLAGELLDAAERGVRVRLLLDDINLRGNDAKYLALDAHPNISVRVFNPCWNRHGALQRGLELILRASSATRRMHNKSWIADGRLAIVGGRNIGDAYFDASRQFNFHDIDIAAVGPIVASAECIFDDYWNSDCVMPLSSLPNIDTSNLEWLREQIAAARATGNARALGREVEGKEIQQLLDGKLCWTENVQVFSDPPQKKDGNRKRDWLYKAIIPLLLSAKSQIQIISPYFIPGEKGLEQLLDLSSRRVAVSVLTNSLAATDVAAVHGAYVRYRKRLIRGGVRLYEMKAEPQRQRISLFGSRGASLHTKAFIIDGEIGFVGSFNFDARSVSLNTEMGVIFKDGVLAGHLADIFRLQTSPKFSYALHVESGRIIWRDFSDSPDLRAEPGAGLWRRMVAATVRFLPIESQL